MVLTEYDALKIVGIYNKIRWQSHHKQSNIDYRDILYNVYLTHSGNAYILFSMIMDVHLLIHNYKHFNSYFEYDILNDINMTDNTEIYTNLMKDIEYKFNLSIHLNDIGDKYIIYDREYLPIIYTLINDKTTTKISYYSSTYILIYP